MPKLHEEYGASKLRLERFGDRQAGRPYRHGNKAGRLNLLTLGQLSRYLVNHNCVMDHADDLVETAWRDAQRQLTIHRQIAAQKRENSHE